ncbi:hypothetical protein Maes01_00800 [Microbulbifer aestuariivivens]|uniref:L,D-TPase catalytic domain-containing protein n=1 Tax=Microbulbifer aestuariivivens TaxID=1908308 RepID=A0ABP9WQ67_9GAMM
MQSHVSLLIRSSLVALLFVGGMTQITPVAEARDYRDPNNPPDWVREYYRNNAQGYRSNAQGYRNNAQGYRNNAQGYRSSAPGASPQQQRDAMRFTNKSWWRHDVTGGTPHIKIDLSEQMAYFYKGGRLAGVSPVSTGKPGHRTPAGTFRISEKKINHRSNLYGHYVSRNGHVLRSNVDVRRDRRPAGSVFRGAAMDYMMRVNGPVSMHAGYVPGYPASHGCIRLPWHMAKTFFAHAPVGTKVSIVP